MNNIETRDDRALIVVPTGQSAIDVFTGEFDVTIDPLLSGIGRAVEAFSADVKTETGREAIKSFSYKLARSKTALDNAGKAVNAKLKELPKKVDENRRKAWDILEGWQSSIRAPLDKFEADEKVRVDKHVAAIQEITAMGSPTDAGGYPHTAAELRLTLAELESWSLDAMEEFRDEAELARRGSIRRIAEAVAAREQYEKDQAELAVLRKAQAERDAKEAREHAEREAREREEGIAREREEAKRIADGLAQSMAIEAENRKRAEAERAEAERIANEERASRQRAEAETASLRKAEEERQRQEREEAAKQEAERAAAKVREENIEHRRLVNKNAADAIANIIVASHNKPMDVTETAQLIIASIARGKIPFVKIEY